MVLDIHLVCQLLETMPVGIACNFLNMGMGLPQNHVYDFGEFINDGRHCLYHIFYSLTGAKESKGKYHISALNTEKIVILTWLSK